MRHYLDVFHPSVIAPLLVEPILHRLRAKYTKIPILPRHGFKLRSRPKHKLNILANQPQHFPLSAYSLLRSLLYRSYNKLERIGLNRKFVDEAKHLIGHYPQLAKTKSKLSRSIAVAENDDGEAASAATYHQLAVTYDDVTVNICAAPHCPIKLLAAPLFGIGASRLPSMRLFDSLGNVLHEDLNQESSDWGITVSKAFDLNMKYCTFDTHLFGISRVRERIIKGVDALLVFLEATTTPRRCDACNETTAQCEVLNSLVLHTNPGYLCLECYNDLFPAKNHDDEHAMTILLPLS